MLSTPNLSQISRLLLNSEACTCIPATNSNRKQLRIPAKDRATLVLSIIRSHVVIGEGIANSANVGSMYNPRIMVRGRSLIIAARASTRLNLIDQKCRAIESSAETCSNGALLNVAVVDERSSATAEYIGCRWFAIGVSASEIHRPGIGIDLTVYDAE